MNRLRYLLLIITGIMASSFQPSAQLIETGVEVQLTDSIINVQLPAPIATQIADSLTDVQLSDFIDDTLLSDSLADVLPESMEVDWQKLFEGWHASHFYNTEDYCEDADVNPFFPDSIYRFRMSRMMTLIPMTYNETVRKYIDFYATRSRRGLRYIMGMADYYFPLFEQILDANGLPLELKYLAVIESALNPVALSRAGASGLWQFMLPTGKSVGLEINSLIDERFDPEKATEAACKYLKSLYNIYDDWYLTLAAYNSGPGTVNRALARSGGKKDYWKISSYLPRETRAYVPLFIAVAYVMTYHCEHNICPVRSNFSVATDTIMVEQALHFDQVAEIMQIEKEVIRFYNPQYKREIIPGNVQPSVLRLPIEQTIDFIEQADSVYAHRVYELLEHCIPVDVNDPKSRQELISHTVKAGETVVTIANLYGVTAQNLRKWNGLSGTRLTQGRKLRVYIDNGGLTFSMPNTASTTASIQKPATGTSNIASTATTSQQKTVAGASNTASATTKMSQQRPGAEVAALNNTSGYITYRVKSGDSLYAIAKKYPGVSVQSIQQANGMSTTNLKIGQVLKIPVG